MADGRDFSRIRLAGVTRTVTPLKPWKNGEFFAQDDTGNAKKDHVHVHVYNPTVTADEVTVGSHVVTAKGNGPQRNQTKHEHRGVRAANGAWAVAHTVGERRLEVADGSPEVPADRHDAQSDTLSEHLETGIEALLSTPDDDLVGVGPKERRRQKHKVRKQQRRREAAAAADDAASDNDDGSALADLFG